MARKGINKAIDYQFQLFENKRLLCNKEYTMNRTCIFISHKKEDMQKAREVANYVIDCGIDIFFDENDPILSNPETNNDPVIVTNAINKALTRSTHMICVVSNKTKESWWVPYEIGYVSNKPPFSTQNIGILLVNDVQILPDYLFLAERIETVQELDSFLKSVSNTPTFLRERLMTFNEIEEHQMKSILK
ncbi:toll/interleukin-1 receptor domain-containing protein [Flavobacterium sp. SUN046]|uniref:toll/interleukin-1 receptor domain-containing protein n=1 Tax=Flavobacterium sp. SUN046 TaxID=3002440 RepID=UPI002DBEE912|nr:toll/interleukin-1 receptor domain-containing protein [Flavobacterium sp. SUN046]MEC4048955.1 toll/interleukin-1 receptor domain-containing protein [Flavobacterium sp. SUN046]